MTQAERASAALRAAEAAVGLGGREVVREGVPGTPGPNAKEETGAGSCGARAAGCEEVVSPDAAADATAREIVFRQLTMMPRSRAQLAAKLRDRGIGLEVAERVLDRFERSGLVDDAAFAEAFVRTKRESRGLSQRALVNELRKVGVSGEIAAAATAGIDRDDEYDLALLLAEKKAASTRGLDYQVRERRIAGMLSRKGFDSAIVLQVAREVLSSPGYSR